MDFNTELTGIYTNILCDLNDKESCLNWRSSHCSNTASDSPLFSFMMATYNDDSLLNAAINSLFSQAFQDWELFIVDNSNQNSHVWEMIANAMLADSRIRGIKSDQNVGWPKAASICLQHLRGKYTSFLAADDVICPDVLYKMSKTLETQHPDILWVGNLFTEYKNNAARLLEMHVPGPKTFGRENRSAAIAEIMKDVYYNSFFHYMKVDFLKENNIDFFNPYYADCAGMTEAMAQADTMIAVDYPVYCLTINTSQTSGVYTWGSYDFIYANQWRSIKSVFLNEHFHDPDDITYAVIRILTPLIENIKNLCLGHCRDRYMNQIHKTGKEIIEQLENILSNKEIAQLFQYSSDYLFPALLAAFHAIADSEIEFDLNDIKGSFLAPVLELALYNSTLNTEQKIVLLIQWLKDNHNPLCIGFSMLVDLLDSCSDAMICKYKNDYRIISEKKKN